MRFDIRFLDSIKHPIEGFIDALVDEPEVREYHIIVLFLDHRNNSAILSSNGEFGEYLKSKFKNNKNMLIKFPENYHNPFHVKTLNKDDYLECGCGWRESEQEHIKRKMIITSSPISREEKEDDKLEMRIITRSQVPV